MTWTIEELAGVRAVALDVDGTIAGGDHQVSERTRRAIQSLAAEGVPAVLLTGRSRANTLSLAREIGITNQVASCNGAVVFDPVTDENTRVVGMAPAEIEAIASLHDDLNLDLTWWTADEILVDHDGAMRRQLIALNESEVLVEDFADQNPDSIVKMMLHGSPEALDAATDEILARAPRGTRSMDVFFEFVDTNATKWSALQYILAPLGIEPGDVMGIGDGGNDVVFLSNIGHAIAMGNARQEVVDAARHQIGHHAHDGAAEIIELAQRLIVAGRA
ncbi:HAD family hydrolase [Mycolicibacterium komossense]|uniref:HAD family phosphatase n=1 Tax=Mycolicibacterium komossense TaxID=1779 RepID=A0ABT3C6T1_9MYCO|nr:HAD family hydrolase [Mycolicibacterium komossense]MCV7225120.1 HAD family phosphatase [Mycolicibacterium komossense]